MPVLHEPDWLRQRLAQSAIDSTCHIDRVEAERRIIPISHGRHMRGWHPVRPGHPAIGFESKLECRTISALAGFEELAHLKSQPVTVLYRFGGKSRRYTPEFFVVLYEVHAPLARLGVARETYLEVKPLLRALEHERALARQFAVLRQATGKAVTLMTNWDLSLSIQEKLHVN